MKAYPAYKDSGVEWLGEIPVGWGLQRLKWLVRKKLQYGANEAPESEDGSLPRYIRITDFGEDGKLRDDTFKSLSYEKAKDYLLTEGDILFARSGATVGKTFQFTNYKGSACFAGYLIKAAPDEKKIISDFLYAFTKSNSYENWKNGTFIQATIQNIGADKYNSLPVPLPPLPEQRAIAAFLDHKTHLIDTYVAKKQQQIERLQAYRTALINQAVTKGLNPDTPMKDSRIEWLGEIPAHWDIVRLKYFALGVSVGIVITPAKYYVDDGIPCLRSLNVKQGRLEDSNLVYISEESNQLLKKSIICQNDLVAVRTGQPGTTAVVDERFDGANCIDLIIIRHSDKFVSDFLCYQLNSNYCKNQFSTGSGGAIQQHFNIETARNLLIISPPFEEQKQITQYLDEETAQIDAFIAKVENQIDRLQAYRTTLISDAVTGKIDVRTDNYRDYT